MNIGEIRTAIYRGLVNPMASGLLTSAMSPSPPRPGFISLALLFLLAAIWGSSFILMKIGLFGWRGAPGSDPVLSGVQLGLLRMTLAGLALLPFAAMRVRKWPASTWWGLSINGFIGSLVPAMLFAVAQTRLPSATAGMLNALSPLWTLLIAVVWFRTAVSRAKAAGLLLGFAGAIGLMSLKDGSGEVHIWAAALVVVATACYGLSINVVRNRLSDIDAVSISAVALSMTALPSGLAFVGLGGVDVLCAHPEGGHAFLAVAALACIGTAAALVLFNGLILRTNALFASSVTYVIPLFALMWGWLDGESIGWSHAAYGAIILSGVRLVAKG